MTNSAFYFSMLKVQQVGPGGNHASLVGDVKRTFLAQEDKLLCIGTARGFFGQSLPYNCTPVT